MNPLLFFCARLSGGGGAWGHVVDRPGAAALSADSQAAGADGVRDAGDLLRRAEEGGALQRGGRAALAGAVVLADPGGVLQRGASPLHALRLRTLEAAGQHGRHLAEVSDHEGGPGESVREGKLGLTRSVQTSRDQYRSLEEVISSLGC